MTFGLLAIGAAILFCIARAIIDFGQRRFGWAVASLVCAALLLSVPIESHAVKFDLPRGTVVGG